MPRQNDPMYPPIISSFDVFVSKNIGTVRPDEYGMSPIRAMLDLVGCHAENLCEGERGEYHADIFGQPFTVVVALGKRHDGDAE